MAVRPIDGNDFMRQLTLDTSKGHYGEFMDGSEVAYTSREIAKFVEDMPTLTLPNEPLTIEQLREMDGEPVWIVEQPDWGHWELSADAEDYLANRDQDFYGLKHDDPAGRYGLHVLGWLAYRRPPEGEEERHGD